MLKNRTFKVILLSTALLLIIVCLSFAKTDHREYKNSKPEECRDCHSGLGLVDNHGPFFVKEHRLLAQKAGNNCADCHLQSFCLDCHKGGAIEPDLQRGISRRGEYMPRSHRADFISTHSIKAADDPQSCNRCHQAKFCQDCHNKTVNKGRLSIKSHRPAGTTQIYDWSFDHAAEARRNLQSCESCHADADVCVRCHFTGGANPHPKNWRSISSKYRDGSKGRTCRKCHISIP